MDACITNKSPKNFFLTNIPQKRFKIKETSDILRFFIFLKKKAVTLNDNGFSVRELFLLNSHRKNGTQGMKTNCFPQFSPI